MGGPEAVTPEPAPAAQPARRRRRRTATPSGAHPEPAVEASAEVSALAGEPELLVAEAAVVEPAAVGQAEPAGAEAGAVESPASAETKKPAARRPRTRRAKAEEPSPVATEPEPVKAGPEASAEEEEAAPESSAASDELPNIAEAPAIGVEIVAAEERQGTLYFTIRDLRNCNAVHNVTSASARKLWSYAISQYLKHQPDPAKINWSGDYGLWQVARRAKKLRYDLVKRQPDGSLRVFYGVTVDGMDGPWAQFLRDEDRGE